MSVMQQIKAMAGQGEPSGIPKFSEGTVAPPEQLEETEAMMQAAPIPGQSLTQSPDSRLPYETPPKFTDIQEFIDETFLRFTSEEGLPDLLQSMRLGLPVEHIAEKYLNKAFKDGEITPDLVLLTVEPTIYMLISIATYAEIEPVLYPEDPMVDEEIAPKQADLYKKAAQDLRKSEEEMEDDGKTTIADFQAPTNVPTSLLARSKEAVDRLKQGESNGV